MQELWILRYTRCLMLIDIYMKFREVSLSGFQVTERTRFFDDKVPREITQKVYSKSYGSCALHVV